MKDKKLSINLKRNTIRMNNIKYTVVESAPSAETNSTVTYGITAYDVSSDKVVAHIGDITCDKARIEHLVELCNRGKLSPIHLRDVVEDFLCY